MFFSNFTLVEKSLWKILPAANFVSRVNFLLSLFARIGVFKMSAISYCLLQPIDAT